MKANINTLLGVAILALIASGCHHGGKTKETDVKENDSTVTDILKEDTIADIEFETISDKDMWLKVNPVELKSDLSKRLADAYNSAVIQNSILTDFDMQIRIDYGLDEVTAAIKNIDITKVQDKEVRPKLEAYKKEMLYLLSVNPSEVDQNIHNPWKAKDDLFDFLSKKYNVEKFGTIKTDEYWEKYNNCPSVPEWEQLQEKRGDKKLISELKQKYDNAKDFDARCIYAIELAHAYEADRESWMDDLLNPAVPIMQSLMREKKYSLYLNELWQKWRVLYQNSKGASKDSAIPNRFYNNYRNICVCTIFSYIEQHPQDIMAINEFLVMACKDNIFREGQFSYGNQSAVDELYLFPEKFSDDDKKE